MDKANVSKEMIQKIIKKEKSGSLNVAAMNSILQKATNKRKQNAQNQNPTLKLPRNNSNLSQEDIMETSSSMDQSSKYQSIEDLVSELKTKMTNCVDKTKRSKFR